MKPSRRDWLQALASLLVYGLLMGAGFAAAAAVHTLAPRPF